jgi:hypothetical protein
MEKEASTGNATTHHARGRHVRLAALLLALGAGAATANTVIVQDAFSLGGFAGDVVGRAPDTVNLPGGQWGCVIESDWGQPFIRGSDSTHWAKNAADLEEHKASIAITLAGYNKGSLRISADVAFSRMDSAEGLGLGFRASVPGEGFQPKVDPTKDFTGLSVNGAGTITLFVNGVAQPDPVTAQAPAGALALDTFYSFSYDVDTASGDVFNIKFNGAHVPDFATAAFTPAATAYAVFLVRQGVYGVVDNFTVTSIAGVVAPTIANAPGSTKLSGTGATLCGTLTGGNAADVSVHWGTAPNALTHVNHLGTLSEGLFSTTVSDLAISTVHYYRCFASNALGTAWAETASSFLSPAQRFTWTGAATNADWHDAANWSPSNGVPDAARETALLPNLGSASANILRLSQPVATLGGLDIAQANGGGWDYTITNGAAGQKLVFDYPDGPACIRLLNSHVSGAIFALPVVLNSDVEISAAEAGGSKAVTFRGPIAGKGRIIAKSARVGLEPLTDTVYDIGFSGPRGGGVLMKRGDKAVTLTGVSDVAFAGGWDGFSAIAGGGELIISGGLVTNKIASGLGVLFGDSGNALVITNGGRLVQAYQGSPVLFNKPGNQVVVAGRGSTWDLRNELINLNVDSNRLVIADGGRLVNAPTRIGWGASFCSASVHDESTVWDVGGPLIIGGGTNSTGNHLSITRGAEVRNTWIWLGGYNMFENAGGSINILLVADGGKLYSGAEDPMHWGSAIGVSGVSGGRVDHNAAFVSGIGSVWDLQGRDLRIGYVTTAGATGAWNSVQAEKGGVLTDVGTLYVGCSKDGGHSASNTLTIGAGGSVSAATLVVGEQIILGTETPASDSNAVMLDGGALRVGEFILHARNDLVPVIGPKGVQAMTVSDKAVFALGSVVRPVAAEGLKPGDYTVLAADRIFNHGLQLDPALGAGEWALQVGRTNVVVRYRKQ